MCDKKIDAKENRLLELDKELLAILLKDNTTGKNLTWARGITTGKDLFYSNNYIAPELIMGLYGNVIMPRIAETELDHKIRMRSKAEVFTPAWVCNAQNNLVDDAWFGCEGVFNTEIADGWITNTNKVKFISKSKKDWKEYIKAIRLEIACGEAPYLTSRYDAVTGSYIEVKNRIGLLDRKLRIVGENIDDEEGWIYWTTRALKSIYGYDLQGDNVFLARENILYTIMDFYLDKFSQQIEKENLIKFAKIIVWNIWQMDGLKYVVPNTCIRSEYIEYTLFGENKINSSCIGCEKNLVHQHNGLYCKVMDWNAQKIVRFIDLI